MKNKNFILLSIMLLVLIFTGTGQTITTLNTGEVRVHFAKENASGDLIVVAVALTSQTLNGISVNYSVNTGVTFIGILDPNTQQWHWLKEFDALGGVEFDGNGDLYVTGAYTGALKYGGVTIANNNNPTNTAVLMKVNGSNGTMIWLYQQASTHSMYHARLGPISFDANNNIYFVSADVNTPSLGCLSNTGLLQWQKSFSVNNNNAVNCNHIVSDAAGNIFITGSYYGNPSYGNTKFPATKNQTSAMFLLKTNSVGGVQWFRTASAGTQNLTGTNWYFVGAHGGSIGLDSQGNIYINGGYRAQQSISFGNNVTLAYNNYGNPRNNTSSSTHGFLVKYNSSGIAQWAREYMNHQGNIQGAMIISANDNIFVSDLVGNSNDSMRVFGTGSYAVRNYAIIEYSSSGNFLNFFSPTSNAPHATYSHYMSEAAGGFIVSGYFLGSVTFDSNTTMTSISSATNIGNGYIVKYSDPLFRPTGIAQETINQPGFQAYPNPFREMIRLHSQSAIGAVQLIDASGKIISNYSSENQKMDIETETLPSGLYLLKHSNTGYTLRIVKQ